MEVSPRGGGNRLSEMLKYATGVDLIKNAVLAAIGEPIVGLEQKPYDGYWAEVILHSERAGKFKKLNVRKDISAEIIEQDLWVKEGDVIGGFSGANEAIGTLVLKFATMSDMVNVMDNLEKWIKVEVV